MKLLLDFPNATLNHVKGHQDDDTRYEDLDYQSRLNVDCDRAAKQTMRASAVPAHRPPPKEGHRATLYIDNREVTTKMDEQIQYAAHSPSMFQYLCERHEWVDGQLSTINWRAIGLAKIGCRKNNLSEQRK